MILLKFCKRKSELGFRGRMSVCCVDEHVLNVLPYNPLEQKKLGLWLFSTWSRNSFQEKNNQTSHEFQLTTNMGSSTNDMNIRCLWPDFLPVSENLKKTNQTQSNREDLFSWIYLTCYLSLNLLKRMQNKTNYDFL